MVINRDDESLPYDANAQPAIPGEILRDTVLHTDSGLTLTAFRFYLLGRPQKDSYR